MTDDPSIDDMWKEIENFGIRRSILDQYNQMSYDDVRELYRTVKERKTDKVQIKKLQKDIEKEGKVIATRSSKLATQD